MFDSCFMQQNRQERITMKRSGIIIVTSVSAMLLSSCAAQFPFIAPEAHSEATSLKELCAARKLKTADVKLADSLYDAGSALVKKGKNEPAYRLLDRAAIHYRIALAEASIQDKEMEMEKREELLAKTKEEVAAYNQILKELKTMEQK